MENWGPNEADIEQRNMESVGNAIVAYQRKGKCAHGWIAPAEPGNTSGEYKCNHCGKVFPSSDAAMDAHRDFIVFGECEQ